MNKKITILGITLALVLVTVLLMNKSSKKDMIKVGILKPITHTALTQIKNGIIDELNAQGFNKGKNVVFEVLNAEGNQVNMKTMSNKLINDNSDLLIGIGTVSSQNLAKGTKNIPVIAAAANVESLGLKKDNSNPGGNVTGLTDISNIDPQIDFMLEIKPNISTLGVIYSSGDKNSYSQVEDLKKLKKLEGIKIKEYSITKAIDLNQVVEKMVTEVDAVYIPTDNQLASLMPSLTKITNRAKVPVFPGADSMVKDGGLATVSIGQYEIGREVGKMAADILSKKNTPSTMPVKLLSGGKRMINLATAKKLNMEIEPSLLEDVRTNGLIFE